MRNKYECQKFRMIKTVVFATSCRVLIFLILCHLNFEFVLNFGFRDSDLSRRNNHSKLFLERSQPYGRAEMLVAGRDTTAIFAHPVRVFHQPGICGGVFFVELFAVQLAQMMLMVFTGFFWHRCFPLSLLTVQCQMYRIKFKSYALNLKQDQNCETAISKTNNCNVLSCTAFFLF